jgi:hypothetical protein
VFCERFGKPTDELVVMRTTGPAGNPTFWTRDRLDKLRRRDPAAADVAEFAKFLSPESSLFASGSLDAVTRTSGDEVPAIPGRLYVAAMDPGTRSNAWTLIIIEVDLTKRPSRFVVSVAKEWIGTKQSPLRTDVVLKEIAGLCRKYGVSEVTTDQWGFDFMKPQAIELGLCLYQHNLSTLERVELYEQTRVLIEDHRIELPPVPHLRDDLLRAKKRVTQSGITIELPKTSDGRHCDFAPSLVLAIGSADRAVRAANRPRASWAGARAERSSDGLYRVVETVGGESRAPMTTEELIARIGAVRMTRRRRLWDDER